MSRRRATVLLCAIFLAACDGCPERRRICQAPPSHASCEEIGRPPVDAPAEEEAAAVPAAAESAPPDPTRSWGWGTSGGDAVREDDVRVLSSGT